MWRDGFRAVVDVEAAVLPGEQVVELGGADELGLAQGVEKAVAEEFGDRSGAFGGHAVEAPGLVEESVGGQYVQMRVEYQVVAEAVDCRNCRDAPVWQVEARLRRVNDAELLVLAKALKCPVVDLYPKRPGNLSGVVRHGRK